MTDYREPNAFEELDNAAPSTDRAGDYPREPQANAAKADQNAREADYVVEEDLVDDNDSDETPHTQPKGCFARFVGSIERCVHKVAPPGGITSGGLTLASGSIGAGILGLPGATNRMGLVLSMLFLIFFACATILTFRMIGIGAQATNIRSFDGMIRALFGKYGRPFSYFTAFIRLFFCFGCCVGYVISAQDCFEPFFGKAYEKQPDNSALKFFSSRNGLRVVALLLWLVCMLPLVIPKHIDSLRYASFVAIVLMVYFCIIIVVHSCRFGLPEHRHNVRVSGNFFAEKDDGPYIFLFRTGNAAMGSLGTFFFAYLCHGNALEVYFDLNPKIRGVEAFTKTIAVGMVISTLIYMFVSIFGYFDFGHKKLQDKSILRLYNPLEEVDILVAYIGVLIKVCVAYALQFMGCRNALYYLLGWTEKYRTARPKLVDPDGEDFDYSPDTKSSDKHGGNAAGDLGLDTVSEAELKSVVEEEGAHFVDNIPMYMHLIAVMCVAVVSLIAGLFIPNINIVFDFAGSICGGLMAFIFPALVHCYAGGFGWRKTSYFMYFATYVMLVVGVIGIVFGTGAAIYGLAGGK